MHTTREDNARAVPGRADIKRLASLAHDTFVADNGAIEIRVRRTKVVIFKKAGADGREVWDERP